jgi:hypothetical protein
MQKTFLRPLFALTLAAAPYACSATGGGNSPSGGPGGSTGGSGGATGSVGTGGADDDGGFQFDAQGDGSPLDPDGACAATVQEATAEVLPVDIVWMIDNSASMDPAIQEVKSGLNTFANLIGSKNLDYKVIMLSLRSKTSPVVISGGNRYPVCIPPPLAGDNNCGNGARFFHSSIDIRSTQPLEQFLGTLAQTEGYKQGQEKGGEPWAAELRTQATKTIVVVTDDNSRLSATDFEQFMAGQNPFNSLMLPDGILRSSWNGLFDGYLFSGIYGWGSNSDPTVPCSSSTPGFPANSGITYTTLVQKTGGVRAKICDGAAAWGPFFDSVAQAVIATAKLSCVLDIPTPTSGTLDKDAVNVQIVGNGMTIPLHKVIDASACGLDGGWYYDNDANPMKVILCPASCEAAQAAVGVDKTGRIEVLFGCATILK